MKGKCLTATELNELLIRSREERWLFDEVVRASQDALLGRLKRMARGLGLREQDAEDSLQEGYLRAYARVEAYVANLGSAFNWLWVVCARCLLDRARSESLRRHASLWGKDGALAVDPVARQQDPAEHLQEQELEQALLEVLKEMGPGAREIVELRRTTPMTIAEVAEQTGRPAGTVGSTLFRLKARLKEAFGD
jgi:RNA polymerase sigma-70 factor (ECF subfamily)